MVMPLLLKRYRGLVQPVAVEVIVVADPDEEERRQMAEILRGAGYQVLEAWDQAGTLALIQENPRALVIVAEETPPGPGPDLVLRLREATEAPLVVIGEERKVTEVEALLLGADYYDRRPLRRATLLARVASLFRRWRERREGSRRERR